MKVRVVVMDEREFWSPDVQAVTTKILSFYAYDPGLNVYCAELTPSAELWWLGFEPLYKELSDEEIEKWDEIITVNHNDPCCYIWHNELDKMDRKYFVDVEIDVDEDEEGRVPKWPDDARELFQGGQRWGLV